ncbi:MAG: NAD(+)/NADH kinase [Candidatus Omnitrophica bacterium]|nr:NAD(+)/NADH kinase [Candidatus Omnitrophota bacterium]
MIKQVFILHNPKIKGIEKVKKEIEDLLKDCGKVVEESPKDADLIITMGGDGTFLKGVHLVESPHTFVYGIKYGKVGFLTHSAEDIKEKLTKVLTGNFKISKRMMLEISVKREGNFIKDFCLNEVLVFRKGIRIIDISVSSRKEEIFSHLRCDGVIISTPTGSTAHSLSASGPVVSPEVECILLVPVAPYSLSWRPVVISSKEILSIEVSQEAVIVMDGQKEIPVESSDRIVVKKSAKKVNIVIEDGFFDRLRSKFHWGS